MVSATPISVQMRSEYTSWRFLLPDLGVVDVQGVVVGLVMQSNGHNASARTLNLHANKSRALIGAHMSLLFIPPIQRSSASSA